jgi:hypothetical protein
MSGQSSDLPAWLSTIDRSDADFILGKCQQAG